MDLHRISSKTVPREKMFMIVCFLGLYYLYTLHVIEMLLKSIAHCPIS